LDILCKISNSNENYTENILCKIIDKLCSNRNLLNSKGLLILNKLCSLISVTKVYTNIADVLLKFDDIDFISSMINILDIFLLTYKETEELRNLLRKLKSKNNSSNTNVKDFFFKLYKTWCFNPISLLILCIISGHFELSYNLILKL
jgi:vacuole morphology and inheritance protein 14